MVVIRLSRTGAKKAPFYHIVAADRRNPRDGSFLERIGYYNPGARGQAVFLELSTERLNHWVKQGAQPSDRVNHLVKIHAEKGGSTLLAAEKPAKKVKAKKAEEAKPEEADASK